MFTASAATHSSQGIATEGVKGVRENQKAELLFKKKKAYSSRQSKISFLKISSFSRRIQWNEVKNFLQKRYIDESFERESLRSKTYPQPQI